MQALARFALNLKKVISRSTRLDRACAKRDGHNNNSTYNIPKFGQNPSKILATMIHIRQKEGVETNCMNFKNVVHNIFTNTSVNYKCILLKSIHFFKIQKLIKKTLILCTADDSPPSNSYPHSVLCFEEPLLAVCDPFLTLLSWFVNL